MSDEELDRLYIDIARQIEALRQEFMAKALPLQKRLMDIDSLRPKPIESNGQWFQFKMPDDLKESLMRKIEDDAKADEPKGMVFVDPDHHRPIPNDWWKR